jgi:transposase
MSYPTKDKRNKDLIKKYDQGWTLRELGEYFNVHHSTADEVVKRWYPIYGKKVMSGNVDNSP